jgi:hypothetical protein
LEIVKIYYAHSDRIQNKDSSTIGDSSMMQGGRFKPKNLSDPKNMPELKRWIMEQINQCKNLFDGEDYFFSLNDMQMILEQHQA